MRWGTKWVVVTLLGWVLAAGGSVVASPGTFGASTTYERLLPRAVAGEREVQNLIGFMYFHGEGVPRDLQSAHYWFHRAAEAGEPVASRNLALLHSGLIRGVPPRFKDIAEASYWWRRTRRSVPFRAGEPASRDSVAAPRDGGESAKPSEGAYLYQTFCGGCHGFNGIAYYVHSPSFALGERMEKPDSVLMRSISNGLGAMPGWGAMLTKRQIAEVVAFVRTLRPAVRQGIGRSVRAVPGMFFRFKPYGEAQDFWRRFELDRVADYGL